MEFESYSIYRESDNSSVSLAEIDVLICKELNLDFSERDYGHFHFTEPEDQIVGDQTSISWAGLLHVIVYYSKIHFGRCTSYDVVSAMAWVRHFAVTFPPSVEVFTYNLMKVLTQNGLYVYVHKRRNYGRENEYFCGYDGNTLYINDTGIYECENRFSLRNYYPDDSNLMEKSQIRQEYINIGWESYYRPSLKRMIIPSEIKSIHRDFFNGGYVNQNVLLPDSLEVLDGFHKSFVRELTFPKGIKSVNILGFFRSHIHTLRLEGIGKCQFNPEAFCDCQIEYLSIPEREMLKVDNFPFMDNVHHIQFH